MVEYLLFFFVRNAAICLLIYNPRGFLFFPNINRMVTGIYQAQGHWSSMKLYPFQSIIDSYVYILLGVVSQNLN